MKRNLAKEKKEIVDKLIIKHNKILAAVEKFLPPKLISANELKENILSLNDEQAKHISLYVQNAFAKWVKENSEILCSGPKGIIFHVVFKPIKIEIEDASL